MNGEKLSPAHRRGIVIEPLVGCLINTAINIGYVRHRDRSSP